MKTELISLYIDDELDLDEKITFVETIYGDGAYTEETVNLLRQEKSLRAELITPVPISVLPPAVGKKIIWPDWFLLWTKPLAGFAAAILVVGLVVFLRPAPPVTMRAQQHRFVVYLPQSAQARIIGTFTGWQPVAMERVGSSGYWTLTLPVPEGEHRYSYLVENNRQIADPTVSAREQDDFGGENTVIEVQVAI